MLDCEEEDGDCPSWPWPSRGAMGATEMECKGCVTIDSLEDENSYDSDNSGDGDLSEGESGEDNQDEEEV